jgi:hypothetical protein
MKKYFSRGLLASFIIASVFGISSFIRVTPVSAQSMDRCDFVEMLILIDVIPSDKITAARTAFGCTQNNTNSTTTAKVYPVCGSATSTARATMPVNNLCSVGSVGTVSGPSTDGTDRWFWGCVGRNTDWKDDTAWCFAPKTVTPAAPSVLYPACGTATSTSHTVMPTTNLCSAGTKHTRFGPTPNGLSWVWGCVGRNTGWEEDTAWCYAPKAASAVSVYPVCGSASGVATSTKPSTNLCTAGTVGSSSGFGPRNGSDSWYWGCVGSNTGWEGNTAWCYAPKVAAASTTMKDCWHYNNSWKISRVWNTPNQDGYWEYDSAVNAQVFYQKEANSTLGTGWRYYKALTCPE